MEGVAVKHLHLLQRQPQPLGRDLRLRRGCAHAHLVSGDGDRRATVARDGEARRAARHPIVGIGAGGAAHADEPVALALRRGRCAALVPAEPRRAIPPGLHDPALGEGQSGQRVLLGFVPDAQLDRVHAEFMSELVHRGFEPERADRFAGSAHEGVGDHVHLDRLDVQKESLRRVDALRRQNEWLGHVVVRSHGDDASVDQGVEPAVGLGAKRHALLRERAAADDPEHALAGEHDPHWPASQLRRRGRQDLVLPEKFAAKAAANEGRGQAHLVLFQPEDLRNGPGFVRHRLRGVVDSQRVALPGEGAAVQLDRTVMLAGRRVDDVDLVRSGGKGGLGVADLAASAARP